MGDSPGESSLSMKTSPGGILTARDGAGTAPSLARRPRRRARADWAERLEIAFLSGPAIIIFLAFVIFPVVMAAYYGFFMWNGIGPATHFVGLENYLLILRDGSFHDALRHNGFIVVLSLVLQGPAAVAIALLLNQKMRWRSLIRVLIFVPYVIAEVIVATGWSLMLQTTGAVNGLLDKMGLSGWTVDWLADPSVAIWSLMVIISWKYIGFAVILFLAGLQSIPEELFEAAAIDGASYWQMQRRITLPLLGVPVDQRLASALRPRVHHLGPVRGGDGRYLDDGDLHGRHRTQRRQLRLRQRGRGRTVPDLARHRPDLPALCAPA